MSRLPEILDRLGVSKPHLILLEGRQQNATTSAHEDVAVRSQSSVASLRDGRGKNAVQAEKISKTGDEYVTVSVEIAQPSQVAHCSGLERVHLRFELNPGPIKCPERGLR